MKKYELTEETKTWGGRTLHRIRALVAFGDVRAGDLGGWVESESNLNHNGNAWVYGNARVSDNARVYGDAVLRDHANVSKTRHYYCAGPGGREDRFTTWFRTREHQIGVACGCNHSKNLEEFLAAVKDTHGDNEHAEYYRSTTDIARSRIGPHLSDETPEE